MLLYKTLKNKQFKLLMIFVFVFFLICCNSNTLIENSVESGEDDSLPIEELDDTFLSLKSQKIEVHLGETTSGFNYSSSGIITYNDIGFTPNVYANPVNVTAFKISILEGKNLAGAIALDIDGQNFSFLLNLTDMTSTPMQSETSWNASRDLYWSPSSKYLLAFCSYEGEGFISINTETKQIMYSGGLKPGDDYTTWWILDSEPKWKNNEDILEFNVAEYCNPFEVSCDEYPPKVITRYKVNLDASTLNISIIETIRN